MITIRKANHRGQADHGWLYSQHTFSFANYHDARHMGFRSLRVINEDKVSAGKGFGTHPHRDMEIFSYVLEGALEHKDSLGNGRQLKPGQVQLMSAGRGVSHSEFNPSEENTAHFLQMWILPRERGLTPSYTEWTPTPRQERDQKILVISSDGRDGSATIHQDADVYRIRLQAGQVITHTLAAGRGMWLQVMRGALTLDGQALEAGDGASIETEGTFTLKGPVSGEALLFDLL